VVPVANRSGSFAAELEGVAELEGIAGSLRRLVRSANPDAVSGDQARTMVALFAEIERVAASGVALFAPVVVETGSFAKEGHGSAAEWLGALSGSSAGVAKRRLGAAQCAASTPVLDEALRRGVLSADQLTLVAQTTAEVPAAAATLVPLAEGGASHQELRDAAARLRAAARRRESERASRARVHAHRYLRAHQHEGGGIRGEFFCDEVAWAKVAPRLEKLARERWKTAGSKDATTLDAHRLDVFIDLLAGSGSGQAAWPETLILIDAAALRRGTTEGDELCEIEGIGPVSVSAATELLSEGGLRYLVKEGFDIKTVTRSTRDIARCIDAALIVRDRTCCVGGCGKRLGLERDHVHVDYGDDGPTELDNLVRLCPGHHALKTHGGWRIEGEPGNWRWVAPARPKSAGAINRARRLEAAKAKANVTKGRNKPKRT
jgi:hypothetical protein